MIVRIPFVKTFDDLNDFLCKFRHNIVFSEDTDPRKDATVQIAYWSNLEAGLGITAGCLATLRPLLRHWFGSRADPSYSAGFPKDTYGRRTGASQSRPVPLSSMNGNERDGLRPDKLAVMVTNIESDRDLERSWPQPSSPSSSEERLTIQPPLPGRMEVGIHQTFEVTRTVADSDFGDVAQWTAREHV